MKRQVFQSCIQFLTIVVGALMTVGEYPPPQEDVYKAILAGLAGALAIWAGSKAPVGGDDPPKPRDEEGW